MTRRPSESFTTIMVRGNGAPGTGAETRHTFSLIFSIGPCGFTVQLS
jgi:hypothetical protein